MEIKSDNPEHGFQFPGTFELSAMGTAGTGLETELPRLLEASGVPVVHEDITWKHSSNGRYVSVRISFQADSREQYDRAHQVLRDHLLAPAMRLPGVPRLLTALVSGDLLSP